MKFCPSCGKQLQFENAEICPACGCRIAGPPGIMIPADRLIVFFLIAIIFLLSIILIWFHFSPAGTIVSGSAESTHPEPAGSPGDNSLSVEWNSMDDWSGWNHTARWSGQETGPCAEYGPKIVSGYGVQGADVHLNGGSMESGISRTFTDTTGEGWNTMTLVGLLSPSDIPEGRWMKIEVNNNIVFSGDASTLPPGNGIVFTVPVHFTRSKTVQVTISHGQSVIYGGTPGYIGYYSLRLARESDADT